MKATITLTFYRNFYVSPAGFLMAYGRYWDSRNHIEILSPSFESTIHHSVATGPG